MIHIIHWIKLSNLNGKLKQRDQYSEEFQKKKKKVWTQMEDLATVLYLCELVYKENNEITLKKIKKNHSKGCFTPSSVL